MSYTIDTSDGYSLQGDFYNLNWESTPTKPGYYWVKDENGKRMVEVYEIAGETGVYIMGKGSPYETRYFSMWLGPIPEPVE